MPRGVHGQDPSVHPIAVVPSTATVVIVVCVSFLVFMIILGVFRIRAAHQRTMRDQDTGKESEMDWDDSALTITVNPMEVGSQGQSRAHLRGLFEAMPPAGVGTKALFSISSLKRRLRAQPSLSGCGV